MVRALSGFGPSTRAAAQWARDKGASDESGRVLQNVALTLGSLKEKGRKARFQHRLLAHEVQRWYVGLGLKMRATRGSALEESGLSLEEWLQHLQAGPWPIELSRKGIVARVRLDCKKCPGREAVWHLVAVSASGLPVPARFPQSWLRNWFLNLPSYPTY